MSREILDPARIHIRFCESGSKKWTLRIRVGSGSVLFHGSGSQKIPGPEPVDPEDHVFCF